MRTDLAIESPQASRLCKKESKISENCKPFCEKFYLKIETDEDEKNCGKPKGSYITLQFKDLMKFDGSEEIEEEIIESLDNLLPSKRENILFVGLGNSDITSDSIGPRISKKIMATRHIKKDFAEKIGLNGLKSVSVIAPGVLGNTGMEVVEIIKGICGKINPDAVIVADALAAGSIKRLFTTIQLCDTGICPGSGVKNSRKELSLKTLGIPVIAIGVPTVVDAVSLCEELSGRESLSDTDLIVTPKDADILCHKVSEIIGKALNIFLQPEIDRKIIMSLV